MSEPKLARSISTGGKTYTFNNESYGGALISRMKGLWEQGAYCDITLSVGNQKFLAHRLVLASMSRYFEGLFNPSMKEGTQEEISLPSLEPQYFSQLLGYAYSGEIVINEQNVQGILESCDFLGISGVCEACCEYMTSNIDDINFYVIYQLASMYNQQKVMDAVAKYIISNFTKVCTKSDFLLFDVDYLSSILSDENLYIEEDGHVVPSHLQEQCVADTVCDYVQHDVDNRVQHLPKLLSCVRVTQLQSVQRESLLAKLLVIGSKSLLRDSAEFVYLNGGDLKAVAELIPGNTLKLLPRMTYREIFNSRHAAAAGGQIRNKVRKFRECSASIESSDVHVSGIDISIRRWDGRPVLGGLKLSFSNGEKVSIGNNDGPDHYSVTLQEGERIIKAQVQSGWLIDALTFHTDKECVLGPYGGDGGALRDMDGINGVYLQGKPQVKYGFLAGVEGTIVDTQGSEAITNLSFVWVRYHHTTVQSVLQERRGYAGHVSSDFDSESSTEHNYDSDSSQ